METTSDQIKEGLIKLALKKKIALPEYVKDNNFLVDDFLSFLCEIGLITKEQLSEIIELL